MKRLYFLLILFVSCFAAFSQTTVIKAEGSQGAWTKVENEAPSNSNSSTSENENVSYNATSGGIYVNIHKGTNKIKLFALTGQLILNGDLNQGRFFIPVRQGIYFLRINNKSYKVICK